MNSAPIDIIVPWVNTADDSWAHDFGIWKECETGDKCNGRFRDCNTLKYVLRSIAENCSWCRYVFLILSSPSQIPKWLNVKHHKIRIVYHKDFIPEKYLPTFNSLLIEMFYFNISELSENFILINDDMFFTQKKDETFFFKNDKPVIKMSILNLITDYSDFGVQQKNAAALLSKYVGFKCPTFNTFHLSVAYNKSVCTFVMMQIEKDFDDLFKESRFRQRYNIIHFIFYYAHICLKKYIETNESRGRFQHFIHEKNSYDFNQPMICLNESEYIDDDDIKNLSKMLEEKFKNTEFENDNC